MSMLGEIYCLYTDIGMSELLSI